MNILTKLRKTIVLTEHEKLVEALRQHKVCHPMNWDLRESTENRLWLNPNNQTCFKSGWFTYQDFYDWMEGKGVIIKGKTDEEKKKFWDVAVFETEHDMAWAFGYHKKHFDLIDDTYYTESKRGYGMTLNRYAKNPLKITRTNHGEIISKVMGDICRWYGDTTVELKFNSHAYTKMDAELQGVKTTLYALGVGYYGACNTPEEIENLSWIADICKYKAAYLYFIKNNIPVPDFDFVYENRYKY